MQLSLEKLECSLRKKWNFAEMLQDYQIIIIESWQDLSFANYLGNQTRIAREEVQNALFGQIHDADDTFLIRSDYISVNTII